MKLAIITAAVVTLLSCAQVRQSQKPRQPANAIPVLRITNDTTAAALNISSLSIDVKVVANIATTTYDVVFYNPNERILEGEFEFPLGDGQQIVRYALDIEGKLREAVVIEKAKARVAFENTIRRKIDPGILEKTKGNNFRTRIYPLPAKGTRHILIAVEQTLEQQNKDLIYQLPLFSTDPIGKFSIKASVIKSLERPVMEEAGLSNFRFGKWENCWQASYQKANFTANQAISFIIPYSRSNEDQVVAENYKGQTYFYANSRVEADFKKRAAPKTIGLFWDISSSGNKRDIEKEKQLLKDYFAEGDDITVSLFSFNIAVQSQGIFSIKDGSSGELLKSISSFQYDGGTQFGILDLTKYDLDEIWLFSDGLGTFGKKEMIFSAAPVYTISSSPSADFSFLKYAARSTNGKFIDLTKLETRSALEQLDNHALQVVNVEYNPAEIEEVVTQVLPVQSSGLSLSGKLKTNTAVIKINLGFGKEVQSSRTLVITRPDSSEYDQVKRIWASMKIAELDMQFEKNKDAITHLGKEFSIVTQNTSLIVLDRVEDYVEHEIVPPVELQKEYFTLLKDRQNEKQNEKGKGLDEAVSAMNELKEWWQKDFSVSNKHMILQKDSIDLELPGLMPDTVVTVLGSAAMEEVRVAEVTLSQLEGAVDSAAVSFGFSTSVAAESNSSYLMADDGESDRIFEKVEVNDDKPEEMQSAIKVNKWESNEQYLDELKASPLEKRIQKYFELKNKFLQEPAFFIDVARFFIEKKEKLFGLQVLSNVAEMKLENAELLRILANELLEANEKELAIETLSDVMKIREEDPQSYRDMALALNETGKYDEAVQLLYKVITESWDNRFGDIKAVAINEMNAILTAHPGHIDVAGIDPRLIYPMPVDVRIVIGWSSDNSDVDLWVTDPRNEKCLYSHNETGMGGRLSQDVTQGFGPEEFCLKRAWKGKYKVEVNLFGDTRQTIGGPIAIHADLFTDFGKPTQKRERINLRVKTDKEVVELGTLKFGD